MKFNDSFTKKSVEALAKLIISTMPKKHFTAQSDADKFMLTGNEKFSSVPGENGAADSGKRHIHLPITRVKHTISQAMIQITP